jgi:hypothetical protein
MQAAPILLSEVCPIRFSCQCTYQDHLGEAYSESVLMAASTTVKSVSFADRLIAVVVLEPKDMGCGQPPTYEAHKRIVWED